MAAVLILMVCEMFLGEVKADILSLYSIYVSLTQETKAFFTGTLRNTGTFYFPQFFQIFFLPLSLSPFLLRLFSFGV